MNRQCSWSGNGALATVSANAVASNTISITGRESVEAALKFLDVGMVVDIYDVSGVAQAQSVTITATSGTPSALTATLTLNQAVTVSATDILVRAGSYDAEVQGLLYALDGGTSTIYSVDRSLYPSYQGSVIDCGGGQLSLDLMQQAYNEGRRRGGLANSTYDAIYTSFDGERYFQRLLTPDKRYVNTVKGSGGFGAKDKMYLDFNGIPVVSDKDCPQRFFFIPQKVVKNYVLSEMEVAEETGSQLIAQPNADSFELRVRLFMNLFNEVPAGCGVLTNFISS